MNRAVAVALVFSGACVSYPPQAPTNPTPVNITISSSNEQQQNITTPITVTPPGNGGNPAAPCTGTGCTPTTQTPGRTPDPAIGSFLPVPFQGQNVPASIAALDPQALAHSCQTTYGPDAWSFLDQVVDTLRQFDTRWGYACQSNGDCFNPIPDAVAYHATAGPEVVGAQGVWIVDVIESYCLIHPQANWNSLGYQPAGRWTSRSRF